jgi:hypothetical protein
VGSMGEAWRFIGEGLEVKARKNVELGSKTRFKYSPSFLHIRGHVPGLATGYESMESGEEKGGMEGRVGKRGERREGAITDRSPPTQITAPTPHARSAPSNSARPWCGPAAAPAVPGAPASSDSASSWARASHPPSWSATNRPGTTTHALPQRRSQEVTGVRRVTAAASVKGRLAACGCGKIAPARSTHIKCAQALAEPGKGRALGDGGVAEALVALEVEGAEAEDALLGRLVQPPPRVQLRGRAGALRLSFGAGMIAPDRFNQRVCYAPA